MIKNVVFLIVGKNQAFLMEHIKIMIYNPHQGIFQQVMYNYLVV